MAVNCWMPLNSSLMALLLPMKVENSFVSRMGWYRQFFHCWGFTFILLYVDNKFPSTIYWRDSPLPIVCFWLPCQNQLIIYVWVSFWALYSVLFLNLRLLMAVIYCRFLKVWSRVCNQEVLCLEFCPFFSRWLCLLWFHMHGKSDRDGVWAAKHFSVSGVWSQDLLPLCLVLSSVDGWQFPLYVLQSARVFLASPAPHEQAEDRPMCHWH